jgi:hypothetical protein
MSDQRERWREYEQQWLRKYAMQRRLARIFKQGDEPDDHEADELDADNGNDNGDNDERHLIDQLADLLVEAGSSDGEISRQDALRWLLHSRDGQALVTRMAQARKRAAYRKDFQMTRDETLSRIVKQAGGLGPLCQRIVKRGASNVTEAELVGMITATAKAEYPDMDDARAFTKAFCGPGGEMLRRAVQVAKVAQVGGDDGDADDDDATAALEELHRLADAHRRTNPELTPSQAFARVFSDPRHAALAHRAHKRPTANEKNAFPFPR